MQKAISIKTDKHEGLYDITPLVASVLEGSGILSGIVNVYRHEKLNIFATILKFER
jgi:thiamine phosphate synthase YjbQ (UPF0047 family)